MKVVYLLPRLDEGSLLRISEAGASLPRRGDQGVGPHAPQAMLRRMSVGNRRRGETLVIEGERMRHVLWLVILALGYACLGSDV